MKYQLMLSLTIGAACLIAFQNCGKNFNSTQDSTEVLFDSTANNSEYSTPAATTEAAKDILNGAIIPVQKGFAIKETATCEEIKRSIFYPSAVGFFADSVAAYDKLSIQAEAIKSLNKNLDTAERGGLQLGKITNSTATGRRQLKRLINYDLNFAKSNFTQWFEICASEGSTRPFPELLPLCGLSSPTCKTIADLTKKISAAKQSEKNNYNQLVKMGCIPPSTTTP